MAYDGTDVWVPVAEYRPHSRSIIYKLDPQTLLAEATFSVDDHIGDVVYDRQSQVIQGVSWGSREFYTWDLQGRELKRVVNGNHFIDYQDCKFVPERYMLCSGMKQFDHPIFGNIGVGRPGARGLTRPSCRPRDSDLPLSTSARSLDRDDA